VRIQEVFTCLSRGRSYAHKDSHTVEAGLRLVEFPSHICEVVSSAQEHVVVGQWWPDSVSPSKDFPQVLGPSKVPAASPRQPS
jgi:hypothetical protein